MPTIDRTDADHKRLAVEVWDLVDDFAVRLGAHAGRSTTVLICLRALRQLKREGRLSQRNMQLATFLRLPPAAESGATKRETSGRYLPLDTESWDIADELAKDFLVNTLSDTLLIGFRILIYLYDKDQIPESMASILGAVSKSRQKRAKGKKIRR